MSPNPAAVPEGVGHSAKVLRVLAVALVAGLVLSCVWQLVDGATISDGGGCATIDGRNYCAMAKGRVAQEPFARRVLVPAIVRILPIGSLADRFRAVDIVAIILMVIAGAVVIRRGAVALGADPRRAHWAAIGGGALVGMLPHATRLGLSVPVLTDFAAMGLAMLWFALFTTRSRIAQWVSVPVAAMTVLTREQWALPIVAIGIVATVWPAIVRRRVGVASVAAVLVALGVAFSQPTHGAYASGLGAFGNQIKASILTPHGWLMYLVNVLFAIGFVPAAWFVIARPIITRLPGRPEAALVVGGALVVGLVQLPLTVFSGYDIARIAANAAGFLIVATFAAVAYAGCDVLLVALAAGSVLFWRPWITLSGPMNHYLQLYVPQATPHGVRNAAIWVAGSAAICLIVSVGVRSLNPELRAIAHPRP